MLDALMHGEQKEPESDAESGPDQLPEGIMLDDFMNVPTDATEATEDDALDEDGYQEFEEGFNNFPEM